MAQLKVKILNKEAEIPEIGSTQQPNTLWVFQTGSNNCELYITDGNGVFVKNAETVGIYNSPADANEKINVNRRYVGRTVNIVNQHGKLREYWWKEGISDEELVLKANGFEAVLENGNLVATGTIIGFSGAGVDPDVDLNSLDGTNDDIEQPVLISGGKESLDVVFGKMALDAITGGYAGAIFTGVNIAIGHNALTELLTGNNNVAIGNAPLKSVKNNSGAVAIGTNTLTSFIGEDAGTNYRTFSGLGKFNFNIAIGYWAGNGLVDGYNNVYIGATTGGRPANEDHKLVIHSQKKGTDSSQNPSNEYYPLVLGDFLNENRMLQVAGKFRLNKHQNATKTDFTNLDEIAVLDVSATNTYKQFEGVDAKEYILQQIEAMDAAQKNRLKTALGI